jgi:hypothetical protein
MSLNLTYTGIANWEDVCLIDDPTIGRKVEHPFNFTMGILLMHTGINTITRQNASEFYMRAKLVEACCGALFTNADGTPRYLATEDVANYIGLASNVSSYTQPQFFSHLRKNVVRSLRETMEYTLKERDRAVRERVLATVEADSELRKLT